MTMSERWSARIGRQEIPFGGERLMGSVAWTQQGRSFDAVRTTIVRTASKSNIGCGIGFELVFILPPLMWLHRRWKRVTA